MHACLRVYAFFPSPKARWETVVLRYARGVALFVCVGLVFSCSGGGGDKVTGPPAPAAVATVEVELSIQPILVGQTSQATAILKDANGNLLTGRQISWSSEDTHVATVSADGLVTGVSTETAVNIKAISEGMTGRATLIVIAPTFNLASITAGIVYACGLTSSGAAYCWGNYGFDGQFGQLGDGTTTGRLTAAPVSGGLTFASITAGGLHTCGVTTGGAAYCWGNNTYGQLGTGGDTTSRPAPTPVAGGLTFTAISASTGNFYTCGLTIGGAAYCWGSAGSWLGEGGIDGPPGPNRLTPTPVVGGLTFTSIATGGFHTCGLTRAGIAYCWGQNAVGQLGDGTTTNRLTPTPVVGGLTFQSLTLGGAYTCGLMRGGGALCWGANQYGQIGDGTTTNPRITPRAVVPP